MGKSIALSLEENNIKIVHASSKGGHIYIDKTKTITKTELDYYLEREKSKEFIVTCNFSEPHHGVLTTPAVKKKYIEKIVESEIRKIIKERHFSFVYTPLGERIIENKKVIDIFYFAVRNEDIRDVLERFYINGKVVKALYPSVLPLASLFKFRNEAILGVSGTGMERIYFLTKNGAIYFIRNFRSLEATLSDLDIQNINMTINYCFQNLRINPSLVLLTGVLSEPPDINTVSSAPLACLYKDNYIHCSMEIFNEFIIPIASIQAPRELNIQGNEFKNIYMLKNGLVTASKVFVALTVLCLGLISYGVKDNIDTKDRLRLKQLNTSDVETVFSEYMAKEAEIKKYRQLVDFINISRPSILRLLIELTKLDRKYITFTSIEARAKDDNSFLVAINGMSSADSYASMQTSFKNINNALDKIEGIEIISKTLNLQDKTFKIELDYKNELL